MTNRAGSAYRPTAKPRSHARDEPAVGAWLPHRLRPPRSLVAAIERRFLLGRIEEGLAGQVVSLQAPAGFGKTELMTSAFDQLRRAGDRFCWMTLDQDDADPEIFLHDLAAALALTERAPLGPSAATAIDAIPRRGPDAAIGLLRQSILAKPSAVVIFLDDLHVPAGAAFRETMRKLLRSLPETVRFVLGSRGRPDMPLSRLRTRDLLIEIGASDLAFTRGDQLRLSGGALTADDMRRLLEVTGGWPALVHLALPALLDPARPKAREDVLAGTHPLFRDFLEEELLADMPAALSDALETCAILDEVPLDLATDLAGLDGGPSTLAMIEQISPPLDPQPSRSRWFRLHPVVRAALKSRGDMRPVGRQAALHIRAASWFAERGVFDKAVRHASYGGDFGLAIEAIRRAGGVNIFLRAGYTVLSRLLADLPNAVIDRSPVLRLCHALVLSKQGQVHAAREIVDDLKRAGGPGSGDAAPIPPADLEHIDGMIDIYEDRNLDEPQIARLRCAAQDFRTYDNWERGWIYNHLCIAYQRKGDLRAARLSGLRALTCYREEKTPYAQIFMMGHVGTVLMASGRLPAAVTLLRDADRLVQATQWSDENIAALVHIPLAASLYQQGHVAEVIRLLDAALPVVTRGEGWVDMFARGFCTRARAGFATAGLEAGLAILDEADVLAIERTLPRLERSVTLARVECLTRAGLLDSALHLLTRLPPIDDLAGQHASHWPTMRERHEALATKARLLVRLGQTQAGLDMARALIASAERADAGLDALTGRVIAVEALWATARPEEALDTLLAAIAFAIPQKATQIIRDGDAAFAQVLRALIRRFGLTTFRSDGAAFLASILGPLHPRTMGDLSSSTSVILTTREAEVLAGLERGSANKQIARELGLTESAVKFHLKNLFRKLGVSRRTLALSVARDVGLIP